MRLSIDNSLIKPGDIILALISSNHGAFILIDDVNIHGIFRVTEGSLAENIFRILPPHCLANIKLRSWPILPVFQFIQRISRISFEEMPYTSNMGIGMVLVVPRGFVSYIFESLQRIKQPCYLIGEIAQGENKVKFYTKDSD